MDSDAPLPDAVRKLPGMTSAAERLCLYRHARTLDQDGQVVDLGCWLGSLTASLAAGISENSCLQGRAIHIHAYDTFVWWDWMTPIGAGFGISGYKDGDSFLPLFEQSIAPWRSLIKINAGDISKQSWTGQPISFLSIDAMKDIQTTRAIMKMFFPHLIAGKSLVFQQDFSHFYTPWVHLIQWRLRDNFSLVEDVPGSGGILFRYGEAIRPDEYDALLNFTGVTDEEWQAAFEHSRKLTLPEKRERLAAAETMRLVHENRAAEALELAALHEEQGNVGPEFKMMTSTPMWKQVMAAYQR
jgi:hypothetical protein